MKNYTLPAAFGLAGIILAATATYAGNAQCGGASWYNIRNTTASGEMMNPNAMTAAHKTLPFGTKLRVKNQKNGKVITVRVNDRGPFIKGRILDLTPAGAKKLGFKNAGHTKVCITKS